MNFQYGAAICAPNQSFFRAEFFTSKINMEQLFPFEIQFFILQFWKNLKINMEQLFALQMDAFLSGAPQGCELQENLMKHKVLGSLFGTQNGTMWSQGAKKTSPDLMFIRFARSSQPCGATDRKEPIWSANSCSILLSKFLQNRKIKNRISEEIAAPY